DRRKDGAARLGQVPAIVERASAEVGAHLGEAPGQLIGRDLPEPELTEPGCVGNVSAARCRERMQLRRGRGVASLVNGLADGAGLDPEARLDRVEEGRLADP